MFCGTLWNRTLGLASVYSQCFHTTYPTYFYSRCPTLDVLFLWTANQLSNMGLLAGKDNDTGIFGIYIFYKHFAKYICYFIIEIINVINIFLISWFCFCTYHNCLIKRSIFFVQEYEDASGNKARFQDSQFLVFVNRILAFAMSGLYLLIQRQPQHKTPLYKYAFCSLSNIMSSWCQYEALKYVSFPSQVKN